MSMEVKHINKLTVLHNKKKKNRPKSLINAKDTKTSIFSLWVVGFAARVSTNSIKMIAVFSSSE